MKIEIRMTIVAFVVALCIGLTGCAGQPAASAQEAAPTCPPCPTCAPAALAKAEPLPTYTLYPTYTPYPTAAKPTEIPTPAATPTTEGGGALKYTVDYEQDRGGVIIRITMVSIAPIEAVLADKESGAYFKEYADEGIKTIGGMKLEVKNTTDKTVNVYPDQGKLVIGDEQIDLGHFMFYSDDVGGEILAGIAKEGVMVFGSKRSLPEDIHKMRYVVSAPIDEKWDNLSDEDYDFDIELE